MAKRVDWCYRRRSGSTSCIRANGFFAKHNVMVVAETNPETERIGPDEALKMARRASRVIVARRGATVVTYDMRRDQPDDATLLRHMLGPTGWLRVPTIRCGKTLMIGFSDDGYRAALE